jgi:IS605 OrfB family transposase
MSKTVTKTVKIPLICEHTNKYGEKVDYKDINKLLWKLQKQTRELKNKTIQLCWEYNNFSSEYIKKYHEKPKKDILDNYSLVGYIDKELKAGNDLFSKNCSTTVRSTCIEFDNCKNEMSKGTRSINCYKSDQPLVLDKTTIKLEYDGKDFYVYLNLLKRAAFKAMEFKSSDIRFKLNVKDKDKSTLKILESCYDKIYSISASKMTYDRKAGKWFLLLAYSFTPAKTEGLDPEKILGVDLGIKIPICASVYGDLDRLTIEGGKIEEFRRRVEARKRSLQKQGKQCGEGRIGHGTKKRIKPITDIGDKIARFRDTENHIYSRCVIEYAVKKCCGTIQMEKLEGITREKDIFLKNWTYFDLQKKIEYKAKEKGIKVVYIEPAYTSKRCSSCGFIDTDNRLDQAHFKCLKCGFNENADYNASQNIGIKNIDKIIKEEYKSASDKLKSE